MQGLITIITKQKVCAFLIYFPYNLQKFGIHKSIEKFHANLFGLISFPKMLLRKKLS